MTDVVDGTLDAPDHDTNPQGDQPGGVGARVHFTGNVASNIAYLLLSVLVMLWYVPYLRRELGTDAYGMIPLAHMVVLYVGIATEGLDVAINRYLTIDLHRNDDLGANRTFNTALGAVLGVVAVLTPLTLATSMLLPLWLNVPAGLETETRLVFGGVAVTFLLTVIAGVFQVSALATHRFDLRNAVRALTLISRVAVIVVLFQMFGTRLWQVGVSFAVSGVVTLVGMVWLWRRLTPALHIDRSHFDPSRLRELLSLSGWSVVNQLGILLFFGADLLVVNRFLGTRDTGDYGSLILLPQLLRDLIGTVAVVLSPALMGAYAIGDLGGLKVHSTRAVKIIGLLVALPAGAIAGLSRPFLATWLGADTVGLDILLAVLVGHFAVSLSPQPLSPIVTSFNRVKTQGIVTLGLGVVNIVLSIVLVTVFDLGMVGVALATALVFSARNTWFTSIFVARLLDLPWWHYLPSLFRTALATIAVGATARTIVAVVPDLGWIGLIATGLALAAIYLPIVARLGLDDGDRAFALSLCPEIIRDKARWVLR